MDDPMKIAVFEVRLHHETNNLDAMIQVVSLTRASAKRFVLQHWFKNGNWTVVETVKIRDI